LVSGADSSEKLGWSLSSETLACSTGAAAGNGAKLSAAPGWLPKSCVQYVPNLPLPLTRPIPISLYFVDRMFSRCPGDDIQPATTASGVGYPAAMFSP